MNDFASTPELILLPAVDVAGGKAVRLTQGEAGTETNYGDPVDAALDFARQGAEWIHLVDLDAAFGRGSNASVIRKVIKQVRGVQVELSGGIRDDASLEAALEIRRHAHQPRHRRAGESGVGRRRDRRYGEAIAVGLDVRGTTLAARGWTQEGGDLWTVLDRLEDAGCSRYVVTDVTKDGTLRGPEPRTAARDHRAHAEAGRRLGRRLEPRRHRRAARTRSARRRGRDRRQGAVRRGVHARRGARCRRSLTGTTRTPGATRQAPPGRAAASSRTRTRPMTAPPIRRCWPRSTRSAAAPATSPRSSRPTDRRGC